MCDVAELPRLKEIHPAAVCRSDGDHSTRTHRTLHAGGGKHEDLREEGHALCAGRVGAAGALDRPHLAQGEVTGILVCGFGNPPTVPVHTPREPFFLPVVVVLRVVSF